MNTLRWIFMGMLTFGGMAQAANVTRAPDTTVPTTLGGHVFRLEVAQTLDQRKKGLSQRGSVAENQGMLFVFPTEQLLQFWMKDTLVHLDIIYFNSDGSFNAVYKNVPPCRLPKYTSSYCRTYPSQGRARYVVELKGGTLERLRISPSSLHLQKEARL